MLKCIKLKQVLLSLSAVIAVGLVQDTFAQKKSVNRLDASIQRNRQLTSRLSQLQSTVQQQEAKILNLDGMVNYYKSQLGAKSDSIAALKTQFETDMIKANYRIAALNDSLDAFKAYREQVYKEKLKIIKDTNIVRVYDMPFDQVRLRTLRRVLEQGVDIMIEQNTDEGFVVSKVFQDRKSPSLFTKKMDSRVEADIKMREHPFYSNKTLFFMDVKVQEKVNKKKPYIEVTDPKVIEDYRKKMLKFFDDILIVATN